jgi:diacylglycerol kinase family enzyme
MTGSGQLPAVIVNCARVGNLARLRRECDREAAANGWRAPLVLATTPDDSGSGLTRRALDAGASLIVAVGGDGTAGACAAAVVHTDVPLAIIPAGSANLTAHALGVPVRLRPALRVAFGDRSRRIDAGNADGTVFLAMAGIGLDAAVVAAAHRVAKRVAGWPAYAAAAAGQLLRRPAAFTVRIDDGVPLVRRAQSVTVGNSGALPGGFAIMPDARLDDGRLDVVVLAPAGPLGWADVGYRVALGSRRDDARLERFRAAAVEIRAVGGTSLPRQVDGEIIAPSRSLSVRVLPAALLVRVPGS